ncbi:MAG: hypothetical protein Q9209_004128 [Squamulea sp. 1 TL-2023]
MAFRGPWSIIGQHVEREPSSKIVYEANYSLARGSDGTFAGFPQKDHFSIDIFFSKHGSPYEFIGHVSLTNRDPYPRGPNGEIAVSQWKTEDHGSAFEIQGSGKIVEDHGGSGDELFDSSFEIKSGTGSGVFEGIEGGGKMKFMVQNEQYHYWPMTEEKNRGVTSKKFGLGSWTFEGMNAVGGGLV